MSKKEKEEGKESIKHDQPGEAPAQASESALLGEEINAKQEAPIREKPAVIEERSGLIQFRVVTNDNKPEFLGDFNWTKAYIHEATSEDAKRIYNTAGDGSTSLEYGHCKARSTSGRWNNVSTFSSSRICRNCILCDIEYRTS